LLYSGPQWIRWYLPALVRGIFFAQSTQANAYLLQNHLRNNVLSAIWESYGLVKLTHKSTHQTEYIVRENMVITASDFRGSRDLLFKLANNSLTLTNVSNQNLYSIM
jgi:hypothetical protein